MAINVSLQHNGGFLPDITPLTLRYYHRGTRLDAMKRFIRCVRVFFSTFYSTCTNKEKNNDHIIHDIILYVCSSL